MLEPRGDQCHQRAAVRLSSVPASLCPQASLNSCALQECSTTWSISLDPFLSLPHCSSWESKAPPSRPGSGLSSVPMALLPALQCSLKHRLCPR